MKRKKTPGYRPYRGHEYGLHRYIIGLAIASVIGIVGYINSSAEPPETTDNPPAHTIETTVRVYATRPPETAQPTESPAPTPAPTPGPWTDEEVEAIARTLAGECYEDKHEDKRRVAETILNRVSNAKWSDTVVGVVTAPSQFYGYWHPSRSASDNDREVATEALRDWYENDCKALSEWLFFESGPNRENVFRAAY